MTGRQVAYATPIALSVIACLVVLVLVWRKRSGSAAARHYSWVMVGQTLWGAGYLAEVLTPSLHGKIFWDVFQVLPTYLTSLEAFRFVLAYTGRRPTRP